MIKTLRITSIIVAALAAGLFVFPMVFGFRSDEEIERFLSLPGVVEEFLQAEGGKTRTSEDQASPLVKQAGAFALYLNPPAPAKPEKTTQVARQEKVAATIAKVVPAVTPKFKVIATSFCQSSPELSLALIDEPGKGRHWIREGSVVSHLTIEQIRDGVVIAKGVKEPFESPVEPRPPRRSLLLGASSVSVLTGDETGSAPSTAPDFAEAAPPARTETSVTSEGIENLSKEEQAAWAERVFAELEATGGQSGSGKTGLGRSPRETAVEPGRPRSEAEAARIGGEEAERLGDLGRELKNVPEDPERAKARSERKEEIKRRMEERKKRLAERREQLRRAKQDSEGQSQP